MMIQLVYDWLACIFLHMVFFWHWWYVFEYSVSPKWSMMFWLDWPPCKQLNDKVSSQVFWILKTGWLVYIHEWLDKRAYRLAQSSAVHTVHLTLQGHVRDQRHYVATVVALIPYNDQTAYKRWVCSWKTGARKTTSSRTSAKWRKW